MELKGTGCAVSWFRCHTTASGHDWPKLVEAGMDSGSQIHMPLILLGVLIFL